MSNNLLIQGIVFWGREYALKHLLMKVLQTDQVYTRLRGAVLVSTDSNREEGVLRNYNL